MTDGSAPAQAAESTQRTPRGAASRPLDGAMPDRSVAPDAVDDAIAAAEAIEQAADAGPEDESGEGDVARRRRRRRRGGRRDRADGPVDAAEGSSDGPAAGQIGAGDDTLPTGSTAAVVEAMDAEAAAGALTEGSAAQDAEARRERAAEHEAPVEPLEGDVAAADAARPASPPAVQAKAPAGVAPVEVPAGSGQPDAGERSGASTASVESPAVAPTDSAPATTAVLAEERGAAQTVDMRPAAPVTVPDAASLRSTISEAGLEWVETRVRTDEVEPTAETIARAPRTRRRRQQATTGEPLHQVETARDEQA